MTGTCYAWDFPFLWSYRGLILTGLGVTIAYTIGTILPVWWSASSAGCFGCRIAC